MRTIPLVWGVAVAGLLALQGSASAKAAGVSAGVPPKKAGIDQIQGIPGGPISVPITAADLLPPGMTVAQKAARIADAINAHRVNGKQVAQAVANANGTVTITDMAGEPFGGLGYSNRTGERRDGASKLASAIDVVDLGRLTITGTITGLDANSDPAYLDVGTPGTGYTSLPTGNYSTIAALRAACVGELTSLGVAATLEGNGSITFEVTDAEGAALFGTTDAGLESTVAIED